MVQRFKLGVVGRKVSDFTSLNQHNISAVCNSNKGTSTPVVTSRIDMDIHTDIIFSGASCCIIHDTDI